MANEFMQDKMQQADEALDLSIAHIALLLISRYKLSALYPGSNGMIEDIYSYTENGYQNRRTQAYIDFNPSSYQANFKRLEWFEERNPKDVECVKYIKHLFEPVVHKVIEWSAHFGYMSGVRDRVKYENDFTPKVFMPFIDLDCFWLPATELEYLEYKRRMTECQAD